MQEFEQADVVSFGLLTQAICDSILNFGTILEKKQSRYPVHAVNSVPEWGVGETILRIHLHHTSTVVGSIHRPAAFQSTNAQVHTQFPSIPKEASCHIEAATHFLTGRSYHTQRCAKCIRAGPRLSSVSQSTSDSIRSNNSVVQTCSSNTVVMQQQCRNHSVDHQC